MNTKLKRVVTVALFFLIYINTFGQNFSKNSIKVGFGGGISLDNYFVGYGLAGSLGYQREIWTDRLRINPNFSFGHYGANLVLDAGEQNFNSLNLEVNLFYDIVKVKSFSLVIGCGGFYNNQSGWIKPSEDSEDYTENHTSEYYNRYHYGGALIDFGFRINSPSKRIAINILPINLHIGSENFVEFHSKLELDIKL